MNNHNPPAFIDVMMAQIKARKDRTTTKSDLDFLNSFLLQTEYKKIVGVDIKIAEYESKDDLDFEINKNIKDFINKITPTEFTKLEEMVSAFDLVTKMFRVEHGEPVFQIKGTFDIKPDKPIIIKVKSKDVSNPNKQLGFVYNLLYKLASIKYVLGYYAIIRLQWAMSSFLVTRKINEKEINFNELDIRDYHPLRGLDLSYINKTYSFDQNVITVYWQLSIIARNFGLVYANSIDFYTYLANTVHFVTDDKIRNIQTPSYNHLPLMGSVYKLLVKEKNSLAPLHWHCCVLTPESEVGYDFESGSNDYLMRELMKADEFGYVKSLSGIPEKFGSLFRQSYSMSEIPVVQLADLFANNKLVSK